MSELKISMIAAVSENGVIGKDNTIPWRMPADMKFFKNTTLGHPVVMGRKTFESFGRRPLLGRMNIVLAKNDDFMKDLYESYVMVRTDQYGYGVFSKIGSMLLGDAEAVNKAAESCTEKFEDMASFKKKYPTIGHANFLIVGAGNPYYPVKEFKDIFELPQVKNGADGEVFLIGGARVYEEGMKHADRIYITRIHANIEGDTKFPEIGPEWKEVSREEHKADEKNQYDYTFIKYEK
jgi:dihydrofolate reductase